LNTYAKGLDRRSSDLQNDEVVTWFSSTLVASTLLILAPSASGQGAARGDPEPPRQWLPPLMGNPSKLSADRYVDDEYPAITIDDQGTIWVVWSSCRADTTKWPASNPNTTAWEWPDNGRDSIVARRFRAGEWSDEEIISAVPGVNHKPSIVAEAGGVRVLWTTRRDGRWSAYERRWSKGN
jgi:hypothetical protein